MIYPDHFKEVLREAIKEYRIDLGATVFNIEVRYMDGDDVKDNRKVDTAMGILVGRRYYTATLFVYPRALDVFEKDGEEQFREAVAHEIAHIETQHLFECASSPYKSEEETVDAWERLTTVLGRYLYNAVKNKP